MSTHLRVLSELLIWQGLDGFQKSFHRCALDKSSLSIGRVKLCFIIQVIFESSNNADGTFYGKALGKHEFMKLLMITAEYQINSPEKEVRHQCH